ncbi:MAG: acetyl-CoA carboxylase biotin carboxylase subunit [Dehalococcoidia bacterium]|nr:acetyl-CoA carboxylase biotin carboxylase subunit [Dehalococcoidia bacterium]MDD5493786.1 acetyl-CoA carboxylase biotin carboxylase subunit [Dehalococcoidia bacterium]
MLKKVLVANRGEIAIRVMRACRELGMRSVAVYSEADKDAIFTKYADEAYCIGAPPAIESYLNVKKIMAVARESGAEGIHPGYGFLAENPNFAYACEREGIKFIGPSSKVIELMGNKIAARQEMAKAGVPITPGTKDHVSHLEDARKIIKEIGYPVIIKPSGGGGGIGMTIVHDESNLKKGLEMSSKIAASTFGMPEIYIEKYIEHPRHIEFQVLADTRGNVVHLGERECSIQRRHQKLIEEAPSPALTPELRKRMGDIAVKAARQIKYESAGTIEFIFSNGEFYFMEMNTRIQVEHPVTEMVTGIDIVKEQLLIASGERLNLKQKDINMNGWAIECRINAEDPQNNFAPSPGKLRGYRSPGGVGIRVDSGVHTRYTISPMYDPMISKLVAWGRNRDEAIQRMRRALYEYVIVGVKTNIPFHKAVMENKRFQSGDLGTHFITQETTLLDDMQAIMARELPLEEKLSQVFDDSKRAAAVAAVMAYAQIHHKNSAKNIES